MEVEKGDLKFLQSWGDINLYYYENTKFICFVDRKGKILRESGFTIEGIRSILKSALG